MFRCATVDPTRSRRRRAQGGACGWVGTTPRPRDGGAEDGPAFAVVAGDGVRPWTPPVRAEGALRVGPVGGSGRRLGPGTAGPRMGLRSPWWQGMVCDRGPHPFAPKARSGWGLWVGRDDASAPGRRGRGWACVRRGGREWCATVDRTIAVMAGNGVRPWIGRSPSWPEMVCDRGSDDPRHGERRPSLGGSGGPLAGPRNPRGAFSTPPQTPP